MFAAPFNPNTGANTQLFSPSTTPFAAVQYLGSGGVRINNQTTAPLWVAVGTSAASSSLTATLPTSGTPSNTWPMAAGGIETFTFGPNYWLTAMTSAGSGQFTVTAGQGS